MLPVLAERVRGTKFLEHPVRTIVNPPESTGMGFWSVNPYVGCELGCTYCYARYAHRYAAERVRDAGALADGASRDLLTPAGLEAFEHRILVKSHRAVLAALDRDLARVRRRVASDGPQMLLIGSATDPYQPAERQYQVTRTILRRLLDERGLRIGLITKSPLVVRDAALLARLSRHHAISVYVSLTSADVRIIKLFEARSAMPHARLRALERLTEAGVRTGLIVAPILPGITDGTRQLRQLLRAAKRAGAQFARPEPLRLYPDTRRRFLPIVVRHFPELAARYRAAFGDGWNVPEAYATAVRKRFRRIAKQCGIAGTDEDDAPVVPAVPAQLSLFAPRPA